MIYIAAYNKTQKANWDHKQ